MNCRYHPAFYEYDHFNNLKKVTQDEQIRTFTYNSLSRLKSATNPESGTINYTYDLIGNLKTKTDARSITTTYTYDKLSRVIKRDYSDTTPDVDYFYDGKGLANPTTFTKGKLTKVSSTISETSYTDFDNLGRILSHKQRTDNQDYTTSYKYNLSGALIEQTYPSGKIVRNFLDQDGNLSRVVRNGKAFASDFSFTASGAVSSMKLGNGNWESTQFNNRLQPTQMALGNVQNATNLWKVNFDYGLADNNGNVKSQQITINRSNQSPLVLNQSYVYDSLSRIKSAEEKDVNNATIWKQTYTFDRHGNRTFDVANTTTLPQNFNTNISNPTVNVANNRFTSGQGYVYDLAGNIIQDAEGRTFGYDGENKQKSVSNGNVTVGTYQFDGDGK
jgi:YD repeat-containing protein